MSEEVKEDIEEATEEKVDKPKRVKSKDNPDTLNMDYAHMEIHQKAYDFSLYLHKKVKKYPKYEKNSLQADTLQSMEDFLSSFESWEITRNKTRLYDADRAKRQLVRRIRMAYDLGFSAMNTRTYHYCSVEIGTIGKLLGNLIKAVSKSKK